MQKMKNLLQILILTIGLLSCKSETMVNKYYTWDDFVKNFGKEMVSAEDVYNSMKKNGLVDFSNIVFDYHFISDKKEKLEKLNDFLLNHYPYKFENYTDLKVYFKNAA